MCLWSGFRNNERDIVEIRLLSAFFFALPLVLASHSFALTVEWSCNPEVDMKEYRVEYSADAGASWGVEATVPHPQPCTSPVRLGVTRYLKPGPKLYRVFALDTAGNTSTPSRRCRHSARRGRRSPTCCPA